MLIASGYVVLGVSSTDSIPWPSPPPVFDHLHAECKHKGKRPRRSGHACGV